MFDECDVDDSGTIDKDEMIMFIKNVTPKLDWSKLLTQKLSSDLNDIKV